jgi:hypothetical protein
MQTILQRVVRKTESAGVVGIKKFPSGDLVIQLKEQAGKEVAFCMAIAGRSICENRA